MKKDAKGTHEWNKIVLSILHKVSKQNKSKFSKSVVEYFPRLLGKDNIFFGRRVPTISYCRLF